MINVQMERFALLIFFILSATLLGCGSTQKEGAANVDCEATIEHLQNMPDKDLCTFASVERMELEIHTLKADCGDVYTEAHQTFIGDKMSRAQKCVEKEQTVTPLKAACASHLEALAKQEDCIYDACNDAITKAKEVIQNCSARQLGDMYVAEGNKWVAIFQDRMAKSDRLSTLVQLKDECDSALADVSQITASNILERIAKLMQQTDALQQHYAPGSQMEQSTQRVLAACEGPLRGSVEWIAATYADELNRTEIRNNKGRKRRRLKRLRKEYSRLMKSDAATHYPNIEAPLAALLTSFDYMPDASQPPKKEMALSSSAESSEPHIDNGAIANDKLPESTPRAAVLENEKTVSQKKMSRDCRKLTRKSKQYSAKVKEYQRKRNDRKVSAYQKKLDQTRTQMVKLFCDPI